MKKIICMLLIYAIISASFPCLAAEELMNNDFSSMGSMRSEIATGITKVECKGGALNLTTAMGNGAYGKAAVTGGDITWENYTVETRVKLIGTGASDQFSVHLRYQYSGRSYSVSWLREKRSFFIMKDMANYSGWAFDNMFFPEPEGFNPEQWNDIKVEVNGARIVLYVNGSLIADWTDEQNVSLWGRVGLGAETRSETPLNCQFDYIKVSGTMRSVPATTFTGVFENGVNLLTDSFFTGDNWNLSGAFSIRSGEYGNILAADANQAQSYAWAKDIVFDNCALDMYMKLNSGSISALVRRAAENIYYECVLDSANGGSAEIFKHVNYSTVSLGKAENLAEAYGLSLNGRNHIRIRTLGDNIGIFYGADKKMLLSVTDKNTGVTSGQCGFAIKNGSAEIADVSINRANSDVEVPETQPVQPIAKADMSNTDETGGEYKRIYVSTSGDDLAVGTDSAHPFKTLARAIEYVKTVNEAMTGNITVEVAGGEYKLDEALMLSPEVSGKNGYYVIFDSPERNAVITTGTTVSSWESVGKNIYRARPDSKPFSQDFSDFYLNGSRKQRAGKWFCNQPDMSFYDDPQTSVKPDGIYLYKGCLPQLKKRTGLSFCFNKSYNAYRCPIDEICDDPTRNDMYILKLQQPFLSSAVKDAGISISSELYSFRIENAIELLDESGEWFYNSDDGYIYYCATPQEDMTTAVGRIPGIDNLAVFCGNTDNYVENIKFSGFSFEYSGWDYMTKYAYADRQPPLIKMTMPDTKWEDMDAQYAVRAIYANNIKIHNSTFEHTSGGGLFFENGVNNVSVEGNIFNDIGFCGVSAGTGGWMGDYINDRSSYIKYNQHWEKDSDDRACENIYIANNLFNECGAKYTSGAGVATTYVNRLYLLHNEVYNSGGNSMQFGWGWDYAGIASLQKNCVMYNYCEDYNISGELFDIGGLYNLNAIMGLNISQNYISNDFGSSHAAIYNDNGSAYTYVSENVVENTDSAVTSVYVTSMHDMFITQNYAENTLSGDIGNNTVSTDFIKYEKGNRPFRANEIIANAGLEGQFRHLRSEYTSSKTFDKSYKMAAYKHGSSAALRRGRLFELSPFDSTVTAEIKNGELYLPAEELEKVAYKKYPSYYGLCVVFDNESQTAKISFTGTINYAEANTVIEAPVGSTVWTKNGAAVKVKTPVFLKNNSVYIPARTVYEMIGIKKKFVYDKEENTVMICDNTLDFVPNDNREFMTYISEKLGR